MPCWGVRQASADPWFPCPKCGYPVDASISGRHYLGTTEPNELGEIYRYYKCPDCATIIKKKLGDA